MLGKLIKYEFREAARKLLPFLAASIVFGLFSVLFIRIGVNAKQQTLEYYSTFCFGLFVLTLLVIFVVYIVVIIQRFYKNLLTDEGYLMFTLPVSTAELIWSKIIVALVSVIIVSAISCLMVYLIISAYELSYGHMFEELKLLVENINRNGFSLIQYILQFTFLFLAAMLMFILLLYTSMSVGYSFDSHKQLYSVLVFFGILIVLQLLVGGEMTWIVYTIPDIYGSYQSETVFCIYLRNLLWLQTGGMLVLCAIFYFVTYGMLSRHLNLE